MTSIDKAAIGWSIGIVAAFMAIAFGGQSISEVTPDVEIPEAPDVMQETTEPAMRSEEPQMADPFADEAAKVKEKQMMESEEKMMAEESMKSEEKMMAEEKMAEPKTVNVSIPSGSSTPGCEETNECYIPADTTVPKGSTVVWTNDDTAAHTVTAGTAQSGPSGGFDSSLISAGSTFEHTFDQTGSFDYFCVVHPWMTGSVTVN
ncbi:MAG: hypothetical protein GWN01_06340 [Nitrosopumilaceae archaeon]|nr:hypothetical protein [Nitrosopumilaceae archaeon]NIU00557.1 hypothetical protein [Nitrosopumilaceae archaeon]NIU86943.1 hypothetical protein [Nitrosopumilaceae archaeon]NIV66407.1 hypothetical protein [Nitrosopumilaceae archaeon]NIX61159.1 hypothetical protein [Nitrosopumilaceae archaeon]